VITRWEEFQRLPEIIAAMSTPPLVIDGRRILAKDSFSRYDGIGL